MELEFYEKFFIAKIKEGLELVGEELSDFDYSVLTTAAYDFETLDQVFEQYNEDKIQWNNRMVQALQDTFEKSISEIKNNKKANEELGLSIKPPHEMWDYMMRSMVGESHLMVSAIAQNWHHKYWSIMARKSAAKTMATGCLIPTIMFSLFVILICLMV